MTSPRKAEANRQNALKSTGPKTPEGKAAVRLNAIKHGPLSEQVLLPGEDEDALRELSEHLRAELQPVGYLEDMLMERIIAAYWRLLRLGRVEAGIFTRDLYGELAKQARSEVRAYEHHEYPEYPYKEIIEAAKPIIVKPTITVTDEKKHQEALSKAKEMEAVRDGESATLGQTFIRDADKANAFSKLSRYETTIERSLYKALHELQRLQAARRAEGNVQPPVAVDVDVSGVSRDDL